MREPAKRLLEALVALPGPPGQEDLVRDHLAAWLLGEGVASKVDAKGNLLAGCLDKPRILVTAHLDEIALMVKEILPDGSLSVVPLGGAHPFKWGEGPVQILAREPISGVLGFGSIHTSHRSAPITKSREGSAVTWDDARVIHGLDLDAVFEAGIRPGTRVVVHPSRRQVIELGGGLVGSHFLDDRADLAAWVLTLLACERDDVLFAATASEEVGGEGALWVMQRTLPEVCIALEIGPVTPDASLALIPHPTVWVSDSYAASQPRDLELVAQAGEAIGIEPQFHLVTVGGSDASCGASNGLCARPITLAFAAENSHGFEVMHEDSIEALAELTLAVLERL